VGCCFGERGTPVGTYRGTLNRQKGGKKDITKPGRLFRRKARDTKKTEKKEMVNGKGLQGLRLLRQEKGPPGNGKKREKRTIRRGKGGKPRKTPTLYRGK